MWAAIIKIGLSVISFAGSLIGLNKSNADKQAGANEQIIADNKAAQALQEKIDAVPGPDSVAADDSLSHGKF